ncbi:LysR substrate-binding domain-containing protein [Paracoccus pacificus]|uniref:LysR substrate-binding domain-containing protein n=1 Tax=Paracoccus pacificus TaxID=1463598 RepID=A0ABW4R5Q9_9RHOB
MLDIRQLRYFRAIAEQGSFSRAARVLNVAQPALSLHVRNMEADLGTPLLFRTPRGVQPTEAGEILLQHARIILDQVTVAEEQVRGSLSDPSGEVRLGLPGTIAQILAVPLITATHQRYPGIRLRIAEAMSGFVLEWLRDGRVDLAVLYGETNDHGVRTEAILTEELEFFGAARASGNDGLPPPNGLLPFATAARMPLILPGLGHGLRDQLAHIAQDLGVGLNCVIDVDSYSNIKGLVAEGLGYSILPRNAIAAEVAAGKLLRWRLSDPPIQRSVYLAHATGRPATNAVSVVQALTRSMLHDLARTGRWIGAVALDDADDVGDADDATLDTAADRA